MTTPFLEEAKIAGITLRPENVKFANAVRNAALEEAAKLMEPMHKSPGYVYSDAIRTLKQKVNA